jgi:hypothetical protein
MCLLAAVLLVGCPRKSRGSAPPATQRSRQAGEEAYAPPRETAQADKGPYDPRKEARQTVDVFLNAYRAGISESALPEMIHSVAEWSGTLREMGDKRLVEPLSEIIADTAVHSDNVVAEAIGTLVQLRAHSAVPVIRQYLCSLSKPQCKLGAAIALAILGKAEIGVPVLEQYYQQPGPLSKIAYAFQENWRAVDLDNPVQESIVSSFFQRICQQASGQALTYVICYLLQKDDKSRSVAFQRAEEVLRIPKASRDNERSQYGSIEVLLERLGGERGRALLDRYE